MSEKIYTLDEIKAILKKILKNMPVYRVILFGSYAKKNENTPYAPKSHDLIYLATKIPLELTDEQETLLSTITRFNIDGRYDDYRNNFFNLCDEEYTKNSINKINDVRNWLIELLNEESEVEESE